MANKQMTLDSGFFTPTVKGHLLSILVSNINFGYLSFFCLSFYLSSHYSKASHF